MIQDLLDFAQISSGKFRKNISTFNIRNSIEKVMSVQKEQAKEKNIDFIVNYIDILESDE
jgi:signal transduction histidine kinase